MKLIINHSPIIVSIPQYDTEIIEGQFIFYQNNTEKILVLNTTASFIWQLLNVYSHENQDISDVVIVQKMLENCNIQEDQKLQVIDDIRNVLNMFLSEGLLLYGNQNLQTNR